MKVAFIGAGSLGFTRRLVMDVLSVPEFRDTEFRLMDIDKDRLDKVAAICKHMVKENKLPAKVVATTNRRRALEGCDYVFCVARVGGLEAFAKDIEIPLKYGVDQCVGDTLCVGGVFYAQRTIPVLLGICADMREVCPTAMLINHTNPMVMNSWAVHKYGGVRYVGLCHGVEGGAGRMAKALNVPREELDYVCAGINHQSWYIKVSHKGQDMLPKLLDAFIAHPQYSKEEPVRIEIMRRFGYFSTESNGHLSEYVPWFRKRKKELKRWIGPNSWIHGETGGYLRDCRETTNYFEENWRQFLEGKLPTIKLGTRTSEHGSRIMEAMETGRAYRGHFNVWNTNAGVITNLPECVVECPCYVDRHGIQPLPVGDLPSQCASALYPSIAVQRLAVEAAVTGNREMVKQAVALDPLCGAVLNLEEIWAMCDEMFDALAPWLPQFRRTRATT
jgi:alpha-galactosidase